MRRNQFGNASSSFLSSQSHESQLATLDNRPRGANVCDSQNRLNRPGLITVSNRTF
jgi:hypothetical protein